MENLPSSCRNYRLAASLHGERLFLASDLRRAIVAEMTFRADHAGCRAIFESRLPQSHSCGSSDLQAFSRSVAFERLADLYLFLGSPAAAFRSLQDAALAALCGEEYDHGEESLPARFLRIRFYHLFDRILSCRSQDARLQNLEIEPFLLMEARRLGGRYL